MAVGRLIGAHAELTSELSAQLVAEHGLTLNEYEVLLLLARAPERAMRRVDLAHEVRLTPSGVTRLLDRLEAAGLVGKRHCETDARVTYAELTAAGTAKLERARPIRSPPPSACSASASTTTSSPCWSSSSDGSRPRPTTSARRLSRAA